MREMLAPPVLKVSKDPPVNKVPPEKLALLVPPVLRESRAPQVSRVQRGIQAE